MQHQAGNQAVMAFEYERKSVIESNKKKAAAEAKAKVGSNLH